MNKVQILGPDGTPYRAARPSMLTGGSRVAMKMKPLPLNT